MAHGFSDVYVPVDAFFLKLFSPDGIPVMANSPLLEFCRDFNDK